MKTTTVFTIGRQFGSGGRSVGRRLAEKLEIPFYDRELIAIAAKESGLSETLFENADEKATSSLFYSMVMGTYPLGGGAIAGRSEMPLNDQLFLIQSKTIHALAEKGPCVIVGRCADYVLRDMPNVLNLFIHAQMPERVKRAIENYGEDEKRAESVCIKKDKQRANFYNYYSDRKWDQSETYDLTIDSGVLGLEGTVDLIIAYDKMFRKTEGKTRMGTA